MESITETYNLTQVNFLGRGCFHFFKKNDTGEEIKEECSQEDYDRMGEVGGSKYNPIKSGFTWIKSIGGALKVDTPTMELGDNEYCIVEEKAYAKVLNPVTNTYTTVNILLTEIVDNKLQIIWQSH